MNHYVKHIYCLSIIVLVIMIGACKKNSNELLKNTLVNHDSSAPKHDFRDSLIGNYNCFEHYSYTTVTFDSVNTYWGRADTLLGPANVRVLKWAADDSTIVIMGQTFYFLSSDAVQTKFWNQAGPPDYAYFVKSNDSIWFSSTVSWGVSHDNYDYYVGHKVH